MHEEARRTQSAHRDYYLWLAEQANQALVSQDHPRWLERLQAEDDNLQAALEWSRSQPNGAEALARLVAALQDYWAYTGRFTEGWRWVEEALANRSQVSPRYRVRTLITAGRLALDLTDYPQATALLDEALVLARRIGDRRAEAETLSNQGYLLQAQGDTAAATERHSEALALWRVSGDRARIADSLTCLGIAALLAGDLPRALALFEESLPLCRASANQYYLTDALLSLGFALFLSGDVLRARTHLAEGMNLARTYGTQSLIARGLDEIAFVAGMSGDPLRAAQLLGATTALRSRNGSAMFEAYRHLYDRLLAGLTEALGAEALHSIWQAGSALDLEQTMSLAMEALREGPPPSS
jgi:tetratricopeptide (TPR) repeat protein